MAWGGDTLGLEQLGMTRKLSLQIFPGPVPSWVQVTWADTHTFSALRIVGTKNNSEGLPEGDVNRKRDWEVHASCTYMYETDRHSQDQGLGHLGHRAG